MSIILPPPYTLNQKNVVCPPWDKGEQNLRQGSPFQTATMASKPLKILSFKNGFILTEVSKAELAWHQPADE
jgi:hypothetical protein